MYVCVCVCVYVCVYVCMCVVLFTCKITIVTGNNPIAVNKYIVIIIIIIIISVYVFMYVCVCMYVCVYVCVHVYMYVCLYVCMSVYMYVCVCMCVNVCMYVYMCVYVFMCECIYIYICMHIMLWYWCPSTLYLVTVDTSISGVIYTSSGLPSNWVLCNVVFCHLVAFHDTPVFSLVTLHAIWWRFVEFQLGLTFVKLIVI